MKSSFQFYLALTLVIFCFAWQTQAQETSIKKQFLMPGEVITGHADLEPKCDNCHSSFDFEGGEMTKLCLDCHEETAADRSSKTGFHGQSPLAAKDNCETCHTDHEGRNADIVGMQPDAFDHSFTRFPLEGAHESLACESCHNPEDKFRDAEESCISCHKDDDAHKGELGEQCETCHQPLDWQQLLAFDHDTETDFPLKGQHEELKCVSCHFGQKFEFSQTNCVTCHKASDIHAGANGDRCENCHQEQGWDVPNFDHDKTDFPLRGKHVDIPCRACHIDGDVKKEIATTCISCHAGEDVHLGRNGEQCESCHNTVLWSQVVFDHDLDTEFPLSGMHVGLSCTQCHTGAVKDPLPLDCGGCHAADDVHNDPDMALCGLCHSTEAWNVINPFDHDFTGMPLIGMHQIVPCESCHIGNQFASNDRQCVSCHQADDTHKGALGRDCKLCHTPNAWNIWRFDHEQHTGYALEGSHENLACDSCHTPGTEPGNTPTVCGVCHRGQDIHNGGFGDNCGRCHNTSNFFELLFQ